VSAIVIDLTEERDRCRSHHPATRPTPSRDGAPRPTTTAWLAVVGPAALALILNGIGGFDPVELTCLAVAVGLVLAGLTHLPKAGES
jgi:hypothetical protein